MSGNAPHPALPSILEALTSLEKDPALMEDAAKAYYRQGRDGWPPSVGLPIGVALDLLDRHRYALGALSMSIMASALAAFTAWRLTKGAYLFDPLVWSELKDTPIHKIPVGLLERLPEHAPLLLFPEPLTAAGFQIDAAHVYLDYDARPPAHLELRFLLWNRIPESYQITNLILDLDGETLEECLYKTVERTPVLPPDGLSQNGRLEGPDLTPLYSPLISAALYLCQAEPDLSQTPRRPPDPPYSRSANWSKRLRLPDKPRLIATGWRWGAAIQRAQEARHSQTSEGDGSRSITPHVRRAHWHLYWVGEGSRKDRSKARPELRWIAATLVGKELLEETLPATIRKVK